MTPQVPIPGGVELIQPDGRRYHAPTVGEAAALARKPHPVLNIDTLGDALRPATLPPTPCGVFPVASNRKEQA